MPIEHIPVTCIDQSAFKNIDYIVMGLAYETQNEIGRHFDESIFKHCLFEKMTDSGLDIQVESPIKLTHKSYEKIFYVDLIVNHSVPYEFKATSDFHPKHDAQLLQYLHLLDLHHGKLINSRTTSVKGRFVSTQSTNASRREFHLNDSELADSTETKIILSIFEELLLDWGTSLELSTYNDALPAILPNARKKAVEIRYNGTKVGTVELILASPDSGLFITAFGQDRLAYCRHLNNILTLSSLECIHWINMNKQEICATTLRAV
ncbi:MAG: GxxExxY protein [Opitutales bacterium]